MSEFLLRQANVQDVDVIVEYNCRLAEESESIQLDPVVLTQGVAALLEDEKKGRYFVAEREGRIIGQIMITYEWSDWRNGPIWWLQSVYVAPDARRQGVFRQLFGFIENTMEQDSQAVGLRLYVENDNTAAQETYKRLSFQTSPYHVMQKLQTPH
ncbi:MAG: GNAT family N-acetyltransferase [Planctomycetales bacterium]